MKARGIEKKEGRKESYRCKALKKIKRIERKVTGIEKKEGKKESNCRVIEKKERGWK
jgi:hypothetical protein